MAINKPSPKPSGEDSVLGAIAGGPGAAGGKALIYMGRSFAKPTARDEKYGLMPKDKDLWLTPAEAMNEFYGWSDKKRRDLLAKMVVGGIVPTGSGIVEAEAAWKKLVESAARFGAAGQKVGPMDLLASYVQAAGGMGKGAWQNLGAFEVNVQTGEKRYAGPGVYLGDGRASQTDTRVDLTDPDTARAMATKLFQSMMGRDPGAGELGAFAKALSTAEASNPITQTTITQYDMETGQPVSQNTSSTGGISTEGKAYIGEQQIKGKKEYGVTQAVTTYQNALEQLIYGSPR